MGLESKERIKFVLALVSLEIFILAVFAFFVSYDEVQADASNKKNSWNTARGGYKQENNQIYRFDSSKVLSEIRRVNKGHEKLPVIFRGVRFF